MTYSDVCPLRNKKINLFFDLLSNHVSNTNDSFQKINV